MSVGDCPGRAECYGIGLGLWWSGLVCDMMSALFPAIGLTGGSVVHIIAAVWVSRLLSTGDETSKVERIFDVLMESLSGVLEDRQFDYESYLKRLGFAVRSIVVNEDELDEDSMVQWSPPEPPPSYELAWDWADENGNVGCFFVMPQTPFAASLLKPFSPGDVHNGSLVPAINECAETAARLARTGG